jgi:multicomponent Na+:H+ antiporter subunit C
VTVNLTLVLTAAVLVGCGTVLMLERSLTRVLVGVILLSNGVNLVLLLAGGPAGPAPLVDKSDPDAPTTDPLPQALMLTAIVITLGTTAFLLAMAYRRWQLSGFDEVQDDVEDALVARLARADEPSDTFAPSHDEDPDEGPDRDPDRSPEETRRRTRDEQRRDTP